MSLLRLVKALSIVSAAIIPLQKLTAQSTATDSALYTSAVSKAIERYHAAAGDQSALYNGSQYGGYQFIFKSGSPYFNALSFANGTVTYDGVFYKDISLLYDQVSDMLVMQDAGHHIQLIPSKVSSFTIKEFGFTRIQKDSTNPGSPGTGFYQQLYSGKISILKKEMKTVQEEISPTDGLQRFIDQKTQYYIKKGGVYYSFKRKSTLMDVLGDKKRELQQFIKKNKLNFRKDRDNMLVEVAAYYDQLTR